MKIQFLGAAHEVTGSCTLLEVGTHKIMIDCGMEQGSDTYTNCEPPYPATDIDCVFLTHAHIDHSGKIPALVKLGFKGSVYTSEATYELCKIMLKDSAHIQEQDAEWKNRKAKRSGRAKVEPEYTIKDAEVALEMFVGCNYDEYYQIYDDVTIRLIDAGHLLGSASIEVMIEEAGIKRKLLFSGDIGNIDRPLIRDPQKPTSADIVVIESTYGDRLHGERKDYITQLTQVIQSTLNRGGNLVIPSFAVGRTQELLYLIHQIKKEGLIKPHADFPVWIDSPLAQEATKIYDGGLMDYYDDETLALINQGEDVLRFPGVNFAETLEESQQLNFDATPKVIISASGMCEAGRIRHHLKHNLWEPQNTILFVGYQALGTLGRNLIEGAKEVKLFGETIQVKAHIEQMEGISGHADRDMLIDWLDHIEVKPRQVFVNHGEDSVVDSFAQTINERLGIKAVAPYNGACYDLNSLECLNEGNKQRIIKKNPSIMPQSSPAYLNLLAASDYLNKVIVKNNQVSNRLLNEFADEINKLAKRWDDEVLK